MYRRLIDVVYIYVFAVDRCVGSITFSGCPSVSASVRSCVDACVLLARYVVNPWTKFHQTLDSDVVEATDEPIRF